MMKSKLHESVLTGALHLRYARWVVDEKDLTTGTVLDRTAEAETIEVTAHPVTDAAAPLVYRRFLDLGQDADTHPLEALIDLVAVTRATPPAPGEPAVTTRACWPVRVVVGDDPRTPIGLLVPTVPLKYADTDGAGRPVPRSISLLRLNDSASAPVARESVPATTDAVARLKICADLADTLDLMHLYGVVLGTRTLESGVFRVLRRGAEVHLADCGDARLRDPAESHGAVADLAWLGRFIEQCLVDRSGRMDVHTTTVFDQTGLDLLARAKSSVPSATPTASQWRSYLARRAVELQGPPVLKSATVEPRFAPIGEAVEVRWSTRYADSMEVIGPDGTAQPVPAQRTDSGTVTVTVTTSGPVTLLLRNPMGELRHETKWVHVFGYPRLTQVPVPAAPPFTSTRTLHELGDLIGSTRMLGSDAARSALAGPPAFDPLAALTQPRRRSWRSRLSRPEPNVAPAFPQDVSSWFLQRPEKFRFPRKKWWRLPWG